MPTSTYTNAFFILCVIINYKIEAQITDPEVKCSSTGPSCISPEDCASLPNEQYQWCGSCTASISCNNGVATFYETFNPTYPNWDDHKKNWELVSTTCLECYFECPPGKTVPPKPTEPICDSTGLGCIASASFCALRPSQGNYQYCGDCSHYVYCGGLAGGSTLKTCNTGTTYDHNLRDCTTSTSATCRECYAPCDAPVETSPAPIETSPEETPHQEEPEGSTTTSTTIKPTNDPGTGGGNTAAVVSLNNLLLTVLTLATAVLK